MEITRTASAGVLLTLDGVSLLLDGVSREVPPYPATPPQIRQQLLRQPPDLLAFTHKHPDHFDPDFVAEFQKQTLRPILGPESLPVQAVTTGPVTVGTVKITAIPSRHIGKAGQGTDHVSFLIEGSRRIFFTGDASPLYWDSEEIPKADVLVATYAYAVTAAGWRTALSGGARTVVLLHLPAESQDIYGLWQAVRRVTGDETDLRPQIPEIGRTLIY